MKISTLLLMAGLHFIAMYFLMYAMINQIGYLYLNINNAYMAALMTAPMLIIEIILMRSMYENKRAIAAVFIGSIIVLGGAFFAIRKQTAVGDSEFLRSMIPHHSGAILMCREARLEDPEVQELCDSIVQSQQTEIDQMERILKRLE